jgi:hypothetical protein
MACKYINGQYIFQQPCSLWNAPCVHGCGYIHLSSSMPGSRKKCCAIGCLSSASDNFDKKLMMDHDLDELPHFLRQVITLSPEFLKKSSTHNNLVAMAANKVCNYNQTHGFSWQGQGPQSVFMNGRVHHCMKIASSTLQNCGISSFIFDDIASLAGSADTRNIDPVILSNICEGLRNENPYCIDIHFSGVEAQQCAEGINVVPRMVHQVQHFDVCSVVYNRQTGAMTLQVKTHTNCVSDINMDSEKVEGICFPLLFPHGKPGYTNLSKSRLSLDEYVMAMMLRPEKINGEYMTAQATYAPFQCIDIHTGELFEPTKDQCQVEAN